MFDDHRCRRFDRRTMSRTERIEALILYYGIMLAEDSNNHTDFDKEILDHLTKLMDLITMHEVFNKEFRKLCMEHKLGC